MFKNKIENYGFEKINDKLYLKYSGNSYVSITIADNSYIVKPKVRNFNDINEMESFWMLRNAVNYANKLLKK